MTVTNEMSMTLLSRSANEGFARVSVASFLAYLDPTLQEISEIKTLVSEAVTNCIVHAYEGTIGTVYIRVRVFEGGRIRISVKDKGRGIENIKMAMTPCYTTGSDDRAGMGFTIMDSFSDKLWVRSTPGKGTCVTLEKRFLSTRGRGEKVKPDGV